VELEKEAEHIHGIVLSDRTGDMNHEQPNLFNGIYKTKTRPLWTYLFNGYSLRGLPHGSKK